MNAHKSRSFFSAAIALMFIAAIVAQPLVSAAQSTTDQDGTTKQQAADFEASFKDGESLDKESVEADPFAPDDRDGATVASGKKIPIPVPLPGGLDYVANGAGTRNAGFGTIRLRGAQNGATAVRAFLYWGEIIDGPAIPLTQTVQFRGTLVTGNLIGVSAPPCWPGSFFVAFRASVIALIAPGINGDYLVSRLPSSITDGRDPWLHAPVPAPRPLSEGTSLVVIYSHSSIPVTARVFINHGATMFFGPVTMNNPLPQPVPAYTTLKHTRLGADGQVLFSTFASAPITSELTFLNATQIKGPGSGFNTDSDWNGSDGGPLNQLWDTQTSSFFSPGPVPPGALSYVVRYISNGDCIVAVAHVLGAR
ncbi:MAG TPA: hypothetical protein VJH03_09850 [Blastocatellia bacterium]|nr:hypothetical protein [Blastocatellia bacterium]